MGHHQLAKKNLNRGIAGNKRQRQIREYNRGVTDHNYSLAIYHVERGFRGFGVKGLPYTRKYNPNRGVADHNWIAICDPYRGLTASIG